jgi:quercetin dioxygenase-like cupin family protein
VDEAVRPYALPAGEGWTYLFSPLGVDFVVKIGEQRHGRRLSVFELTTRAGEEPPVHTHATEDEIFYVLDGQAVFSCGEERFEAAGGTCVFLPRGIPHSYRITGGGDARLLVITAPAPDDGTNRCAPPRRHPLPAPAQILRSGRIPSSTYLAIGWSPPSRYHCSSAAK